MSTCDGQRSKNTPITLVVIRDAFITIQSLYMIVILLMVPNRYYKTYDTILQFEIWLMILCAVIILVLFPNYVVINNLNYLMTVLVLNSF